MKKSIILLMLCLLAFCCPVQAEHLKFMGIPLTGTITQFQQKLAAKGVTYNKRASESAEVGVRCFNGSFAGSKANFVVWYNPSTKIVYGAKAVYPCTSKKDRDQKFEELKSMLSMKYAEESAGSETKDGFEYYTINVTDETGEFLIGVITLYQSRGDYPYDDYDYVQVEYLDAENYMKNQDSKMNDL